jgi:cortactin
LTDYATGFGGKYGVQTDRVDKSAKGWGETQKTDLHASQTDASKKQRGRKWEIRETTSLGLKKKSSF